jgi:Na+-translocating ferredoxin:NAD+ oxidoreductase RnfG subunit
MILLLWLIVVVSGLLLASVVAVEETRVREAKRDARSWAKRACTHRATSFQAYPGDDAERAKVGRRS